MKSSMSSSVSEKQFFYRKYFYSSNGITDDKKIKPDYFYQVMSRPHANPVFITADWRSLRFIKVRRGMCLYFKKSYALSLYDFSVCYNREIWVLFSTRNNFSYSADIGHNAQLAGATKVLVILLDSKLV